MHHGQDRLFHMASFVTIPYASVINTYVYNHPKLANVE